jgi:RNA polymerase sigma-B factor
MTIAPDMRHTRSHEYQRFVPLFTTMAKSTVQDAEFQRVRERLIRAHLPIAEHIAQRFRNRGQPKDDLVQVAVVGLINAVDRFDPDRGTDFLAFAVPTITGEIRRYFRDSTWSMRVPRRLKELHSAVNAAAAALGQELGRAPRPSELAAELDLPVEEVYEGLQVGYAYRAESLDKSRPVGDNGLEDHVRLIDQRLAAVENQDALRFALARLSPREVEILTMRFFEDMTQSQIGERLGLSQMHISRLLSASLTTLREALRDNEAAASETSTDE